MTRPIAHAIDHLVLTVRDIDAACDFYASALCCEIQTFAGGRKALVVGEQKINLQSLGQETRNHAGIGSGDVCLLTDRTPQQVVDHLTAAGITIAEGPVAKSGARGPITSVYFTDPDGNLIEIASYDG